MTNLWARVLLFALFLSSVALAEVTVPSLTQRVTDLTQTLDATQQQTLENKLAAFEKQKGAQLAVLIIPTTQPEAIEPYAMRVAEAWKLGRKGVDDGVLLLIAKDDHKLRIEVGYGLEGALNDATAKRIVAEIITPFFKRSEFYAGVDAGVDAIIKVVEGEALPTPSNSPNAAQGNDPLGTLLGGAFVIYIFANLILRQFVGPLPSGLVVGGLVGALAWLVLASLLWAGVAAFIALVFSLLFGASHGTNFNGMGTGSAVNGWGGSSGARGGDFGGGGFGGGGGGFGGGGASGGW